MKFTSLAGKARDFATCSFISVSFVLLGHKVSSKVDSLKCMQLYSKGTLHSNKTMVFGEVSRWPTVHAPGPDSGLIIWLDIRKSCE